MLAMVAPFYFQTPFDSSSARKWGYGERFGFLAANLGLRNSWRIYLLPTQSQVSNSNDKRRSEVQHGTEMFMGWDFHWAKIPHDQCLPHDLDMRFHAL